MDSVPPSQINEMITTFESIYTEHGCYCGNGSLYSWGCCIQWVVMLPPIIENNWKIPIYVGNETSVTSNYVILIKPCGTILLSLTSHNTP